jgi:hypothetical protein
MVAGLPQAFRARLALGQTTSPALFSSFRNLASLPIRRASSDLIAIKVLIDQPCFKSFLGWFVD